MKITIFTPTYNRSSELLRVYESLKRQTNLNFEWLIIDDGSTDDTSSVIQNLINDEVSFPIRYFKKENGGKYTAHNYAVSKAAYDLFVCLDSDDYLVDDAVDIILKCSSERLKEENIGIIALKKDIKGTVLSSPFPKNVKQCRKIDLDQIYKCKGEFTLIYKTNILKYSLYPIIENERFVGENVIYDNLDKYGEMILLEDVITVCEYLENGYTSNFNKLMLNNPTGYKLYYKQRIDLAISLKERINYIIRYHAFSNLSNSKKFKYDGSNKILVFLMKPVGFLAYLYYKYKL